MNPIRQYIIPYSLAYWYLCILVYNCLLYFLRQHIILHLVSISDTYWHACFFFYIIFLVSLAKNEFDIGE